MKKMNKRGVSMSELPGLVITVVVAIIILGAGILALTGFRDSLTANTLEYNSTVNGITSLSNTSAQFPVIGTIIGVAILISVVVGGFVFAKGRGL